MWLFETDDFMPRNQCGPGWTPWLQTWYQAANLGVGLAYLLITLMLYWYLRERLQTRSPNWGVTALFMTFMLLCGTGHVIEGVGSFYVPTYRLFALWHTLTALVSLATPFAMAKALGRNGHR